MFKKNDKLIPVLCGSESLAAPQPPNAVQARRGRHRFVPVHRNERPALRSARAGCGCPGAPERGRRAVALAATVPERLTYLLDQHGLTRADLVPLLGTAGRVSEALNGKGELSLSMIR